MLDQTEWHHTNLQGWTSIKVSVFKGIFLFLNKSEFNFPKGLTLIEEKWSQLIEKISKTCQVTRRVWESCLYKDRQKITGKRALLKPVFLGNRFKQRQAKTILPLEMYSSCNIQTWKFYGIWNSIQPSTFSSFLSLFSPLTPLTLDRKRLRLSLSR